MGEEKLICPVEGCDEEILEIYIPNIPIKLDMQGLYYSWGLAIVDMRDVVINCKGNHETKLTDGHDVKIWRKVGSLLQVHDVDTALGAGWHDMDGKEAN